MCCERRGCVACAWRVSIAFCDVQRVCMAREAARVHEGSVVPGGRVVQGDAVSRERGRAGCGMCERCALQR